MTDDLVKRVARAFGASMYGDGRPWGSFDEREQDALRRGAHAAIAAMPGWEPIETAPRDGTKVDLWMRIDASLMSMGWSDEFRLPEAWFEGGRWFHHRESGVKSELEIRYITHWMPMPDSPALSDPAPAPRDGGPA